MGDRFRLVANEVDVVAPPEPLPNLPVARAVWEPRPDLATSAEAWLTAGAAAPHRLSTALSTDELHDLAEMVGTELLVIDEDTQVRRFEPGAALEPGLPPPGEGVLTVVPLWSGDQSGTTDSAGEVGWSGRSGWWCDGCACRQPHPAWSGGLPILVDDSTDAVVSSGAEGLEVDDFRW